MHESALARQILERVLERLAAAGGRRVLGVHGWIAETESLRPEALDFHFRAHARGTPAAGAELALELHHVRARCASCATEYAPEHHLTLCPSCGHTSATLLGQTGIAIEHITVE
jgi:hydrogenase nickel incorporation protein HypA/HybF